MKKTLTILFTRPTEHSLRGLEITEFPVCNVIKAGALTRRIGPHKGNRIIIGSSK